MAIGVARSATLGNAVRLVGVFGAHGRSREVQHDPRIRHRRHRRRGRGVESTRRGRGGRHPAIQDGLVVAAETDWEFFSRAEAGRPPSATSIPETYLGTPDAPVFGIVTGDQGFKTSGPDVVAVGVLPPGVDSDDMSSPYMKQAVANHTEGTVSIWNNGDGNDVVRPDADGCTEGFLKEQVCQTTTA